MRALQRDEPGPCTSPLEENPKDDADDDDGDEKKDAADGKDKHQSKLRWQCDACLVRDITDYFCCVCMVITKSNKDMLFVKLVLEKRVLCLSRS